MHQLGLNPEFIISAFDERVNIKLNPTEALNVSYENEGKNIRFETLDNFSLIVDIGDALGIANKAEPQH